MMRFALRSRNTCSEGSEPLFLMYRQIGKSFTIQLSHLMVPASARASWAGLATGLGDGVVRHAYELAVEVVDLPGFQAGSAIHLRPGLQLDRETRPLPNDPQF